MRIFIRKMYTAFQAHPLVFTLFTAGLVMAGSFMLLLYSWSSSTYLPQGVHLQQWPIGGMSYQTFEEQWTIRLNRLTRHEVKLMAELPHRHSSIHTLHSLGLQLDMQAFNQDLKKLREGSRLERWIQRWRMRGRSYTIKLTFDPQALQKSLHSYWEDLEKTEPRNAIRKIDHLDQVIYQQGAPAYRIDYDKLGNSLMLHVSNFPNWPDEGHTLSLLSLPLRTIQPKVTVSSLKKEKINRKIVEFSTILRSNQPGRRHNIEATAQTIHNRLLAPGEIFDFAEVVKTTAEQDGYREAPVIVNGRLAPGIGGGICQVSTTLYNAALLTGMSIVERKNHSIPVGYIPIGRDATYSTDYINFRFQNHHASHLLIRTKLQGQRLTISFFGDMDPSVSYQLQTESIEKIAPPVHYVNRPHLRPGQQQVLKQGKSGYKVTTVRLVHQNGKLIDKELISEDVYPAVPTLMAVRRTDQQHDSLPTSPTQPQRLEMIEDGIRLLSRSVDDNIE